MRLLISASFFLTYLISTVARDCVLKTQCSCAFDDDGKVIDITSLGNTDKTPRFKDVLASSEGNYYSFNPCYAFNEGSCQDAASCIINSDQTEQIQIGDASKVGYKYDSSSGDVVAAYTSGPVADLKLTEVLLQCDPNACDPVLTAQGQQDGGQFQLTLKSICACPGSCTASGSKACSGGLSGGSILLIILAFFSQLENVVEELHMTKYKHQNIGFTARHITGNRDKDIKYRLP